MKWNYALQVLLLACIAITGYGIPTVTMPPSGSIIAGFENEGNFTVFCEVFDPYVPTNESIQQITLWFLEDPDDPGSLDTINVGEDPRFLITGDPVPNTGLFFNTNLTITSLTADLDRMFLHCGIPGEERTATFTLRIYPKAQVTITPSLIEVNEGENAMFNCSGIIPQADFVVEIQRPGELGFTTIAPSDPRLSLEVVSNIAVYTFGPVVRAENGSLLRCTRGGELPISPAILHVFSMNLPVRYEATTLQGADGQGCPTTVQRDEARANINQDIRKLLQENVLPQL